MKYKIFAIAAALVLAGCGGAGTTDNSDRDDSGEIVDGGELGVFAVQEGDCINLPQASGDDEGVESFAAVACDEPHDAEIYRLFDVPDVGTYPGDEAISNQADEGCFNAFEPFVGVAYEESEFFYTFFTPTQASWDAIDDREVICVLFPGDGEPQLTVSLEGAAS